MDGLDPATHASPTCKASPSRTDIFSLNARHPVGGRVKPGHDDKETFFGK